MSPKPLPAQTLKPNQSKNTTSSRLDKVGILLGDNLSWNPATLPNGHVVLIGASGSGKTQNTQSYSLRIT